MSGTIRRVVGTTSWTRLRRALGALPFLPQAALDLLRPAGRTAGAFPPATSTRRLRDRVRAVSLLLRLMRVLCVPPGCRRTAFAYCRALAKGGAPARLFFGVRELRPGEPAVSRVPAEPGASCPEDCGYVGHVWASAAPAGRDLGPPGDYVGVVRVPARATGDGWRRG